MSRAVIVGTVTGDPLMDVPEGTVVSFEPARFAIRDASKVPQAVDNWTFFDGALLAITIEGPDGPSHVGTAVVIAPGLAISAAPSANVT
jgi:hypothetical protein